MESLAYDGRLVEFDKAHLSHARISDRTYEHLIDVVATKNTDFIVPHHIITRYSDLQ